MKSQLETVKKGKKEKSLLLEVKGNSVLQCQAAGIRTKCIKTLHYLFRHLRRLLVPAVEDLLVVIHPDFSQPHLITGNYLSAFGESVRAFGAEHMAHNGAGDDFQLTPTLPHLQAWKQERKRYGLFHILL